MNEDILRAIIETYAKTIYCGRCPFAVECWNNWRHKHSYWHSNKDCEKFLYKLLTQKPIDKID